MDHLQETFGDSLYSEANRLIDLGCVLDVRILQAGSVITGIVDTDPSADSAAARHRVYIRHPDGRHSNGNLDQGTRRREMTAECSCGEHSPCAHIAAVTIAAEKSASSRLPKDDPRAGARPSTQRWAGAATRSASAQEQQLYYLLESLDIETTSCETADELQVSLWVGQRIAGSERIHPDSARPFTARSSSGVYPRYVGPQDKEILQALSVQHIGGQWALRGEAGTRLLQQAVATGRTYWQSFHARALRPGSPRHASFVWETLPHGDQRLTCELAESVSIVLGFEPPIYLDAAIAEWGDSGLPVPRGCCGSTGTDGRSRRSKSQPSTNRSHSMSTTQPRAQRSRGCERFQCNDSRAPACNPG